MASNGSTRGRLWTVAAAAVIALHLFGLYSPGYPDAGSAVLFPGFDKVAHVGLFALPTFVLCRVVGRPGFV
ncbi:MAG: hypothetical protein Q4G35_09500, partial [Propionibacteriaceae bacterium]|nr:hypothetical protein [Propionibacteriaceae bacterium]